MTLLELELLKRAVLAAALIGVAAPAIGVFLVQRRLSLLGDGIGHVAFAGVAAGLATGTSPLLAALVAAALGAIVLELLRERGRTAGDVALALVFYGGIAAGLLLIDVSDANANLISVLFGSLLTVQAGELWVLSIVSLACVGLTFGLRKELFTVCYDEEVARVSGLPVRFLNIVMAMTAACTVAVGLRVVGVLLVAAMLVLPVASAQQLTRSFRATVLSSISLGVAVSIGGLGTAYLTDVRPAAAIVACGIAAYACATLLRPLAMRHSRR